MRVCEYGKGECKKRAVYRISGETCTMWEDGIQYKFDACLEHAQAFEDEQKHWIGGNKPMDREIK